MSGFTKKAVDSYIRTRVKYWVFDLGRKAPLYLKDELGISNSEELTEEDQDKVRQFQKQVIESTIVTGGCFTSMLLGEEPNDIDVYLNNFDVAELISNLYLRQMIDEGDLKTTTHVSAIETKKTEDGVNIIVKSQGVAGEEIDPEKYRYFEAYPGAYTDEFFRQYRKKVSLRKQDEVNSGNSYKVSFLTSNAITLHGGIQIIVRFVGSPELIHSNFDFIHATNYWTWDEGVVYNEKALSATLEKRLYYFGSKFPVATIFRMRKFIERGWRISAGEMLKIAFDTSRLDLTDVNTLREQSIGMDSAYFSQVISILSSENRETVDRTYLFQAIEIAFNMADKQNSWLESKEVGEVEIGDA